MRWIIARHGQTQWNVEGRAQGHTDLPLDEVGLQQAKELAEHLKEKTFGQIWSSDLSRAKVTAEACANSLGLNLNVSPALRERAFGEFEGLPFAEFKAPMQAIHAASRLPIHQVRPPGGESLEDVAGRIRPWIADVESVQSDVLVVSHGGTCAVLLSLLLTGDLSGARAFRLGNCAYSEVSARPDHGYILNQYNVDYWQKRPALVGSIDGSSK